MFGGRVYVRGQLRSKISDSLDDGGCSVPRNVCVGKEVLPAPVLEGFLGRA